MLYRWTEVDQQDPLGWCHLAAPHWGVLLLVLLVVVVLLLVVVVVLVLLPTVVVRKSVISRWLCSGWMPSQASHMGPSTSRWVQGVGHVII